MIQNIDKVNPRLVMSRIRPKTLPADVIDDNKDSGFNEGLKRLDHFHAHWISLQPWKLERMKWAKYYNGEQWHEKVQNDLGQWITEEELISSQGKIPLKQNLIKPIFNSIVGSFRSDRGKSVVISRTRDKAKETEMLSNAMQSALDFNDVIELDVASLIERGISGNCFQRLTYSYYPEKGKSDLKVETINPNYMFWNTDAKDPLWRDLRVIGRVIDMPYGEVLAAFGKSPAKARKLSEIYKRHDRYHDLASINAMDPNRYYSIDFLIPYDDSFCRVIEAWEKKTFKIVIAHDWYDGSEQEFDGTLKDIEKLNQYRIQKFAMQGIPANEVPPIEAREEYAPKWVYGFYSPWGDILDEGDTPYWHGTHPFILPPNHMVDGKMTGIVYDLYDTQRQLNRLLALQDFILGTSAKNTLIVDEASLNGQNPDDIAESYVRVGGVIVLKLKDGAKPPFELGKNVANLGISEMIALNMKILQDISGVHPSLQGQQAPSGTPASRVITEAQQSTVNLKPFLESFNTFRKDRNEKALKIIQQYYNEPRWIAISGNSYSDTAKLYDPEMVKDVEFDLKIAQSADSPVYRNVIDEALKEFLTNGLIDFETYLTNTSLPFADTMLESLRNRREQAASDPQGAMAGVQQDMKANPNAMAMLQKAIRA